jgi:hypothetical protein
LAQQASESRVTTSSKSPPRVSCPCSCKRVESGLGNLIRG